MKIRHQYYDIAHYSHYGKVLFNFRARGHEKVYDIYHQHDKKYENGDFLLQTGSHNFDGASWVFRSLLYRAPCCVHQIAPSAQKEFLATPLTYSGVFKYEEN